MKATIATLVRFASAVALGSIALLPAAGTSHAAPLLSSVKSQALLGTNLIVNGDAEANLGANNDTSTVAPVGWHTTSNFSVVQYGTLGSAGAYPSPSDPGPLHRGRNFFAGGLDNAASSASQLVDVSTASALIDTGSVTFRLAGYLGGWESQGDNATLIATFRAGDNSPLGTASIGPVTAEDRHSATGLLLRATSGRVPAGTRQIGITVRMIRTDGSSNDGYADNLSLVFATPAPPSSQTKVQFFSATVAPGGQQVALVTSGVTASIVLVIDYPNGSQMVLGPKQAGPDGHLAITWTVPSGIHGAVHVTVDSAGKVAQGSFTVN